jgi:hypothetical protein
MFSGGVFAGMSHPVLAIMFLCSFTGSSILSGDYDYNKLKNIYDKYTKSSIEYLKLIEFISLIRGCWGVCY